MILRVYESIIYSSIKSVNRYASAEVFILLKLNSQGIVVFFGSL